MGCAKCKRGVHPHPHQYSWPPVHPLFGRPCTKGEVFTLVVFDAGTAAAMSTQNNTGKGYSGVTHGIIPNIPCDATTAMATAGSLQEGKLESHP